MNKATYMKAYYLANKAKFLKRSKEQHSTRANREYMKSYHILKTYGLTKQEVSSLLQLQDSKCPICKTALIDYVVDHSHKTNQIRSLLCRKCNAGLGLFCENVSSLENAIAYLNSHATPSMGIP